MNKLFLLIFLTLMACSQATPVSEQPPRQTAAPPVVSSVTATMLAEQPTSTLTPAGESTVNSSPVPAASLPEGPVTIVALGDSLTQGDGDDSGRGYPGRLLEKVNAVRPDSTMMNLGQSGWSSDALIQGDQGIESQLDRAVTALEDAVAEGRGAVALVWIGSNDLWYLYEYGGDISDEAEAQDLEHFRSNIDQILSRLRATGATVLVALLDDQSKRPVALQGQAFTAITPEEMARLSAHVVRYNEIIRASAEQHGALTVDFNSTDIFTNPETLYYDGNHPNQAGYDQVTEIWWEGLLPLLR